MVDRFIESKIRPLEVVVHPTVLLSVVDHYNRVAQGTSKRVVGSLLGEVRDGKLHVLSSYAVPFEEDKDPRVWFHDHVYHEDLAAMFKKVSVKEKIVGWYSTGPKIKANDLQIHELYRKYTPEPVFVILEVQPKANELPIEAYYAVSEKTHHESFTRTFKSIPSTFGADEAEEIGVEHLLRDIRNASTSTLATKVQDKRVSLKLLISKLQDVAQFLKDTRAGKYAYNMVIIDQLQNIFNELPDLANDQGFLAHETNDHYLGIYVGSILRTVLSLHGLVTNKIKNKQMAQEVADEVDKKAKDKKAEGDKKEDKKDDAKPAKKA